MKKIPLALCLLFGLAAAPTAHAQAPAPVSNVDGQWRGRSDGGSCNAPLEYMLTIEGGIVDGTATDATARGPVPNPKKSAPPPPTPGLWQIHGLAKPGSFSLMAVSSVRGTDRRGGKLAVSSQGGVLTVTETGGCGRTARLARG